MERQVYRLAINCIAKLDYTHSKLSKYRLYNHTINVADYLYDIFVNLISVGFYKKSIKIEARELLKENKQITRKEITLRRREYLISLTLIYIFIYRSFVAK